MHWILLEPDTKLVAKLEQEFNCSPIIARVMANRGIVSLEDSRPFFNPSLDQFHDPFLMQDMDKAVERIIRNIRAKKPILIFGDYDVDGTTGAAMLFLTLQSMGARVHTYIPNRELEGYGLSIEGINHARSLAADLLITCDCGINAYEQIEYAQSQKIEIIVTDHHTPNDTLPVALAILNPKRPDCAYPFKGLCGGGVAFKLASALILRMNKSLEHVYKFLDLITLGTAADMVPILGENRVIVYHGLQRMSTDSRVGLGSLLGKAGLGGQIPSVGQLVFGVAPRINAAGRLGDANRAVELLTTSEPERARELASELDLENKRRQEIQQTVVDEALLRVNAEVDLESERAIVLADRNWHSGVVGIVASRIKEEFHRPVIIISIDEGGLGKGSARSIRGLDLYTALTAVNEHLEGYGGHPMAAGLTVKEENLDSFMSAFISHVNTLVTPEDLIPTLTLDGELKLPDIDTRFMIFLEKLSPFGPGNMRPKFVARQLEVSGNPRVIGNGDHIRFKVRKGRTTYNAIGFNQSQHYEKLIKGFPIDLAFVVEINEWQGQSAIQLNVRDIKLSELHT